MSRKKMHNHVTRERPWRPQFALEKMLIRCQFGDYSEADELIVLSSHQKNAYTTVNKKQKPWSISKEPEEKGTMWQLQAKIKTREVWPTAYWEMQCYFTEVTNVPEWGRPAWGQWQETDGNSLFLSSIPCEPALLKNKPSLETQQHKAVHPHQKMVH